MKTYEYIWLDGYTPEANMRSKVKATDEDAAASSSVAFTLLRIFASGVYPSSQIYSYVFIIFSL